MAVNTSFDSEVYGQPSSENAHCAWSAVLLYHTPAGRLKSRQLNDWPGLWNPSARSEDYI